jgi:hypothetical protein
MLASTWQSSLARILERQNVWQTSQVLFRRPFLFYSEKSEFERLAQKRLEARFTQPPFLWTRRDLVPIRF